jgi:hypothetical protein
MARLVGIVLVLWLVYSSVSYSLANVPQPTSATDRQERATATTAPGPEVAMGGTSTPGARPAGPGERLETGAAPEALAAALPFGIYTVGELTDHSQPAPEGIGGTVRGGIAPGLYATQLDAAECSYQLWRIMRDRSEQVIGEEQLVEGRLLVTINEVEPDWFISSPGCERWARWQPLEEPLVVAANGDYWVGDLATGLWSVPPGCRWERVVGFRGAELHDVIDSTIGPGLAVIDANTLGIRLRGCGLPAHLQLAAGAELPVLVEPAAPGSIR